MNQGPNTSQNSAIGRFLDEFKNETKQTAADTGKAIVSEPKKILESILGKTSNSDDVNANGEQGIEPVQTGNTQDPHQQQQLMVKKQIEDKQRSAKLLQLHRQRLEEEKQYFQKRQQEDEMLRKQKEKQEEEQKQHQVMQLKRERQDSIQLQSQVHGKQGSHEQDRHKG